MSLFYKKVRSQALHPRSSTLGSRAMKNLHKSGRVERSVARALVFVSYTLAVLWVTGTQAVHRALSAADLHNAGLASNAALNNVTAHQQELEKPP